MLLLAVALSAIVLVGGEPDRPRITSPENETVVQKDQTITIVCEGDGDLKWEYPEFRESKVDVTNEHRKTILKKYNTTYLDVGYYICYTGKNSNKIKDQVYIYVKDERHPVAMATLTSTVTVEPSGTAVVPCRPTSPDVELHLIKLEEDLEVVPDANGRVNISKDGFIIHNVSIADSGVYKCCPYEKNGQCEERYSYFITINVKNLPTE